MSEMAPKMTQTEQGIHQTLETMVDPKHGFETGQFYPHAQGETKVLMGGGQEFTNLDGSKETRRELSASRWNNEEMILDDVRHTGFATLRTSETTTKPRGIVAKIRGEKPETTSVRTEAHIQERQSSHDSSAPSERGNTLITRSAVTSEDGSEAKDVQVRSKKHTTHSSKGNGGQSYEVRFSSPEKEAKYADLVQKVALKSVQRASQGDDKYDKRLINRYTTERSA